MKTLFSRIIFTVLVAILLRCGLQVDFQVTAEEIQYVYNSMNQLVEIRRPEKVIRYIYDDAGNRTGMTVEILVVSPSIASLSPRAALVGASGSTVKILGSNFSPNSVVQWNGNDRATTFINSSELQITLSSADLAVVGTASVVVVNPTPAFAPSNAALFTIVQQAAVSGRVTSAGNGLQGVTVSLSGTEGGSTVTDANGYFNFAVLFNGNYTLTPSKTDYTFDPINRGVDYTGISQSNLDFVATLNAAPVNISGRVFGYAGRPNTIAFVSLTDSQGVVLYARTNISGTYRFKNLPRGGTYTLRVYSRGRLMYQALVLQANNDLTDADFFPEPN